MLCSIYCPCWSVSSYSIYLSIYMFPIRVESGLDDPDNLVTFLQVGQVGLICKLNYLDVTQISHVL